MNNPTQTSQPRHDELWHVAKKRAAFKRSFATYFFVNCLLVAIWFFTSGPGTHFWPIWPMLGWGLGLVFQYLAAYQGNKFFSEEKEYNKLKDQS